MNRLTAPIRPTGFTLIEVMTALAITGILILGVATLFSSSSRAGRLQTAVGGLNESGRFAMDVLGRDLRMAGYRDSDWTAGAIADPITATDGLPAAGGDSITIRYESTRDCNFAVTAGGVATNAYVITNNTLECNGAAIVAGVEEMQIYFGDDTDANGVPNRFLAAGTAGLNMQRVVSVRVHLLVRTNTPNVSAGDQAYYFDHAVRAPVGDGQIRREYSLTVALRNPM